MVPVHMKVLLSTEGSTCLQRITDVRPYGGRAQLCQAPLNEQRSALQ